MGITYKNGDSERRMMAQKYNRAPVKSRTENRITIVKNTEEIGVLASLRNITKQNRGESVDIIISVIITICVCASLFMGYEYYKSTSTKNKELSISESEPFKRGAGMNKSLEIK